MLRLLEVRTGLVVFQRTEDEQTPQQKNISKDAVVNTVFNDKGSPSSCIRNADLTRIGGSYLDPADAETVSW